MVDAAGRGCVFSCVALANQRCPGCKINSVHVSKQLRSLTGSVAGRVLPAISSSPSARRPGTAGGADGGRRRPRPQLAPSGGAHLLRPTPLGCRPAAPRKGGAGQAIIAHDCTALQARTVPHRYVHNPNKCNACVHAARL